MRAVITQEALKKLLEYDPDTGLFKWLVNPRNGSSVGDVAGHIELMAT